MVRSRESNPSPPALRSRALRRSTELILPRLTLASGLKWSRLKSSLRGRYLKGKGKGVLGARETGGPGHASLAFLSRLKLPFLSLSNAYLKSAYLSSENQNDRTLGADFQVGGWGGGVGGWRGG